MSPKVKGGDTKGHQPIDGLTVTGTALPGDGLE